MWTRYARERHHAAAYTTPPAGEAIFDGGAVVPGMESAANEYLATLFGAPDGAVWRSMQGKPGTRVCLANPVYAESFRGRTYALVHGTHFRADVDKPRWLK